MAVGLFTVAGIVALAAAIPVLAPLPGPGGPGSQSPGPSPPPAPSNSTGGPPPATQAGSVACNAVGDTPTPSALLIPLGNPYTPLSAGGTLTAIFEVKIVQANASDPSPTLVMPSVFAFFPLTSGGSLTAYFPPANLSLNGPGWLGPYSATTPAGPSASFAGTTATLSTEKIAVMSSVDYGNLSVAFRWHWSERQSNGSTTSSAWTVPTADANWPTSTPSSFFPAAQVDLVRAPPASDTIGRNVTVWLSGFSSDRKFGTEVEFPTNGSSVQYAHTTAPSGNLAPFSVSVPLINYDGYLFPGTYLVHVHDACGALLYSLSINAVYASQANITFEIQPAACGPIGFDGSEYASGMVATVPPSQTPYAFSVPSCAGWTFSSWSTSGSLHVSGSNQLLVSGDGTFTVTYSG